MSLRATTISPVTRSVDTVTDLEAMDTSFLVDGDDAFTSATAQRWNCSRAPKNFSLATIDEVWGVG